MTPSDLIVDLKGIHTPPKEVDATALLSPWPLVIFALLLSATLLWSWRRKTTWRREGHKRLDQARGIMDPQVRWEALIALFKQVAGHSRGQDTPGYLFLPTEQIGKGRVEDLAAEIERRLR